MLTILFVCIFYARASRMSLPIVRPRDFAVPLWSECSTHDERPFPICPIIPVRGMLTLAEAIAGKRR